MADDKSGTNLASGGVVVATLAAMGLYYFHREAPLLDSRPAVTDASIVEQAARQTIEARLWQDPFEAIGKALDKSGKSQLSQPCHKNATDDSTCIAPLTAHDKSPLPKGDGETLVLGVTVSGAPYAEDVEQRRRTRYAVLAGLERAGFVPKDARHIDYFVWKQFVRRQSPASLELVMPPAPPLVFWSACQPPETISLRPLRQDCRSLLCCKVTACGR